MAARARRVTRASARAGGDWPTVRRRADRQLRPAGIPRTAGRRARPRRSARSHRERAACPIAREAFEARRTGLGPREAEIVDFTGPPTRAGRRFSARRAATADRRAAAADAVPDGQLLARRAPPALRSAGAAAAAARRDRRGRRRAGDARQSGRRRRRSRMACAPAGDVRARIGELARSIETAALDDARRPRRPLLRRLRRPARPQSDRPVRLRRRVRRGVGPSADHPRADAAGYDDAYQQFIEPVVAAGETTRRASRGTPEALHAETSRDRGAPSRRGCARRRGTAHHADLRDEHVRLRQRGRARGVPGGTSTTYIYSRYANPTVQAVEAKLAALEGAEAALVTSSGMAATTTALFGLLSARRGSGLQRRDLRRHPASDRGLPGALRRRRAIRLARRARVSRNAHRTRDQGAVVREPDQPDAALRGHPQDRGGVPGARRHVGHRQHLRESDQPAAARPRRRSRDALGDEIPERAQRRHRGRADRVAGDDRPAGTGAKALRRRARAGVGVCACRAG